MAFTRRMVAENEYNLTAEVKAEFKEKFNIIQNKRIMMTNMRYATVEKTDKVKVKNIIDTVDKEHINLFKKNLKTRVLRYMYDRSGRTKVLSFEEFVNQIEERKIFLEQMEQKRRDKETREIGLIRNKLNTAIGNMAKNANAGKGGVTVLKRQIQKNIMKKVQVKNETTSIMDGLKKNLFNQVAEEEDDIIHDEHMAKRKQKMGGQDIVGEMHDQKKVLDRIKNKLKIKKQVTIENPLAKKSILLQRLEAAANKEKE